MRKKIKDKLAQAEDLKQLPAKHKGLLIKSLILALCLVLLLDITGGKYFSSTISIQYKGIGAGLNPDGTRFDTNELIGEDVLKAVFEAAKLTYEPEATNQFEVRPILPRGIVETIKQKREKGEPYTYFPNEFEIRVKPKLFGGINIFEAQKLSSAYKTGYETYFKNTYQYPFVNLDNTFGRFEYSKYDYPEVTKIFGNEYKMLISYLSVLKEEDPNYRSEKGYSFQDMLSTLESSRSLDLNRISAMVSAFNLTKNKELLVLKYEYMVRRYDLEKNKDYGEYAISKDLLAILKSKENGVVLPSIGGSAVTVKSVDDSYDPLAKKLNDALVQAGNRDEDIKFLQREIVKHQSSTYTADQLGAAEREVISMIGELSVKIGNWVTNIKELADEYFEKKYGNAIRLTGKSHLSGGLSVKKFGLLVILLWAALIGVTLAFRKGYNVKWLLETVKRSNKHLMKFSKSSRL